MHLRTQFNKLKLHCVEVTERLETSECQISTISQEYRKLLQEKENELNRLKANNVKLRQEHKQMVNDDTTPLKELAGDGEYFENGGGFETVDLVGGNEVEWMGEYPVHDVVTTQETITQLQTELAKVRGECEHWRSRVEGVSVSIVIIVIVI